MLEKLKDIFKNKHKVVKDNCLGYEIQVKRWWFPLWTNMYFMNTFETIKEAEWYIKHRIENWKH